LVAFRGAFITLTRTGALRIIPQASADASTAPITAVGGNLAAAAFHYASGLLAVGGKEQELVLWDVSLPTGPVVAWKARPLVANSLDMQVEVWIRAIAFLPASAGSGDAPPGAKGVSKSARAAAAAAPCGHVLAVATHYRQLRVYDTSVADRRPIASAEKVGDYPFAALALSSDGASIYSGDNAGFLRRFALARVPPATPAIATTAAPAATPSGGAGPCLRETGIYRGAAGAITGLAAHPDPSVPYLACVSLDRVLRVFNAHSRQLVRRVHLKQRLTGLLWETSPSSSAELSSIVPEGAPANAGVGTRALAWQDATRKDAEAAVARKAEAEAKAAGLPPPPPPASAEEGEEGVWRELDRRAVAVGGENKRRRVTEEEEDEEEEDEAGLGDSEEEEEAMDGEEEEAPRPPVAQPKRGGRAPPPARGGKSLPKR
jgi:hypothetical protein